MKGIMRTPLGALTWELWRRGQRPAKLAIGCVTFCALVNWLMPETTLTSPVGKDVFPIINGLMMALSLLLMLGVFNFTEYNATRDWNGFPYRLFVLPVRTWRLVTLPTLAGLVAVELLYWAWVRLVWTQSGQIERPEWFAVLLGSFMVFYLSALWTLAGFRILRVLVLGLGGVIGVGVACLPFSNLASEAFSEKRLTPIVLAVAVLAYGTAWVAVARQRRGGGFRRQWAKELLERMRDVLPQRTKDFSSAASAQFWFEWRRSGLLLPLCALFALLFIVAPLSWIFRNDPKEVMGTFVRLLGMPLVLAFAVGKGFVKPDFWSTSLSLPQFLVVRPLSAGDFVAAKMKVASLSVVITWLLVFGFIALWLPGWAALAKIKEFIFEFRLIYSHTWLAILILTAGALMVLTWRCLVSGLWVGMSGRRSWYVAALCWQVILPLLLALACGIWSQDIDREIKNRPDLMAAWVPYAFGWILAGLVICKLWIAAGVWSKMTPCRARQYLLLWLVATIIFVALAVMAKPWADSFRIEHLYVLTALLLFPLTRLGLAPLTLSKNRHQ